jgi:hypothetical protein
VIKHGWLVFEFHRWTDLTPVLSCSAKGIGLQGAIAPGWPILRPTKWVSDIFSTPGGAAGMHIRGAQEKWVAYLPSQIHCFQRVWQIRGDAQFERIVMECNTGVESHVTTLSLLCMYLPTSWTRKP